MAAQLITSILMIAQLAVAAAIIGLVATKMNSLHAGLDVASLQAQVNDTCMMGRTNNGVSLCYLAYGFSGVSILATAALGLLLCCTCNLCGLGFLLDTIFSLVGTAWWVVGGVVFNYYNKQPDVAALPNESTRNIIVDLFWVACALFGLTLIINMYRLGRGCCGPAPKIARDMESGGSVGMYSKPLPVSWDPSQGPPPGYPKSGRVNNAQS